MKTGRILLLIFTCYLTSCGPSTKIEKTWADPSFTKGSVNFHKVLVIAQMPDESTRRIAEDKMVAQIKTATAVQSYTYLQPSDTVRGVVDDKLKKDSFDGLVVMRLSNVDKSTSYVPGTTYGGWYGRYGYYGGYGSSGYYQEDKTYYVETSFYSLEQNKLLWSATTSSLNPSKLDKTMDGVISTLKEELVRQGLVKP